MTYNEPQNFTFKNNQVDLEGAIAMLWQNDGSVTDVSVRAGRAESLEFPADVLTQIDASWTNLEQRAAAYLQQHENGPDRFYSGPVLRFGGFDVSAREVTVHEDIDYRTVTGIRSNVDLYQTVEAAGQLCTAYVVKSILITRDNKLVLGQRNFFGDWPWHRYECPGGFLTPSALERNSIVGSAIDKVTGDYQDTHTVTATPFMLYSFPRILETIMLCIARIDADAAELQSSFYSDLLVIDNTPDGLAGLLAQPLDQFHPPSRVAIELYARHIAAL